MADPERRGGRTRLSRTRLSRTRLPETGTGSKLDTPRDVGRRLPRPTFDPDSFGTFAEQFARFMGTATFLLYMTGFVAAWLLWNSLVPAALRFDPYAFIFLTLVLSLQASYAAPLILLAQNRQEQRDRVQNEQDRQANTRAHADMEYLAREVASLRMALGEVATRDYLRSELRGLLGELEERLPSPPEAADGDTGGGADTRTGSGLGEPVGTDARADRGGPVPGGDPGDEDDAAPGSGRAG